MEIDSGTSNMVSLCFSLGPAELSINTPESFQVIYGPQSKCLKSNWYDQVLPAKSLNTVRDKAVHNQRRQVWDRGFSSKGGLTYYFLFDARMKLIRETYSFE